MERKPCGGLGVDTLTVHPVGLCDSRAWQKAIIPHPIIVVYLQSMKANFLLELLSKHQLKIELLLVALVLGSALINYMGTTGGPELLMITMSTLASFYFVTTYAQPQDNRQVVTIATKTIGIASAVCVVGLLFTILHLTGATQMLAIGLIALGVAGLLLLYTWLSSKNNFLFSLLIRVAMLGGISLSTLLELMKQTN